MSRKLSLLLGGLLIPTFLFAGTQVDISGLMGRSTEDNGHFGVQQVELAIAKDYSEMVQTQAFASFYSDSSLQLDEANVIVKNPFKTLLGVEHKYLENLTVKAGRQRLDFGIVNSLRNVQLETVDRPYAVRAVLGSIGSFADGGHLNFDFDLPTAWSVGIGAYDSSSISGALNSNANTMGNITTLRAQTMANFFGADHTFGLSAYLNNILADVNYDSSSILGADLTAVKMVKGHEVTVQGEFLASTFSNNSNDVVTTRGAYGTISAQLSDMCSAGFRLDLQEAAEGTANSDMGQYNLNESKTRYNFFLVRRPSNNTKFKLQYVIEENSEASLYAQLSFGLVAAK